MHISGKTNSLALEIFLRKFLQNRAPIFSKKYPEIFGSIFMDSNKPIDPTRKASLVAGILYLITFISSIPGAFLLAPVLNNPNYIVSGGANIQVISGACLDLVNALACIGTAVALF